MFDLFGREVSSITVTDGTGIWNGDDFTGKRLPAGIYTITGDNGLLQRLGVSKALEKAGVKPGDRVRCGNLEWEW